MSRDREADTLWIQRAVPEDLPAMLALYENARRVMAERGNATQWGGGYPQRGMLEMDIAQGVSYVCRSQAGLEGTFCFTQGVADPSYQVIREGAWLDEEPYGVVHRLASAMRRAGVGRLCLEWCFARCGNLRIDTHRDNTTMQRLLAALGYQYCGVIICDDDTDRLAFQKRA